MAGQDERARTARDGHDEVDELARLFREHPAWRAAAHRVDDASTSDVYFSSRPGKAWHLARREGETLLCTGRSADPDFVFRFTPGAVERLADVEGGPGSFAVELFRLMTESDPSVRVDFRIAAPFARLLRRGYLTLLASGGFRVLAFGASRGVHTLADLRALVARIYSSHPEPWECRSD